MAISVFIQRQDRATAHHPISIIDMIFRHPQSQSYLGSVPREPKFSIPRYALSPSLRMSPNIPRIQTQYGTRNEILDWAFRRMLERVDKEASALLDPNLGFVQRPKMPKITWDRLLNYDMLQTQEVISSSAPVIFAFASTLAVNRDARKKLEAESSAHWKNQSI